MDEEYEWDQAKAKQNLTRHGISFETAKLVFDDPFAVAMTGSTMLKRGSRS
jgi:uncharacterized DUF497 family protein